MAFPKNKSRRIVVNNHSFRWKAKAYYKTIQLSVISEECNAQKLFATFQQSINGKNADKYSIPFIITSQLLKDTIIYGLSNGYTPENKGNDLDLGDLTSVIKITPNDHAAIN